MIATVQTPPTEGTGSDHVSQCVHWRQLKRYSTVERAEEDMEALKSQGIDAVLSMIDGLCVLVPNPRKPS